MGDPMKKSAVRYLFLVTLLVFATPGVLFAAGMFEGRRGDPEEASPEEGEVPQEVDVPQWAQLIMDGLYRELYPGPEGTGFIGVGTGTTREEALAAAAVEFAANVSTEVESAVLDRAEGADGEESFSFLIESEVRSQAIISGLTPDVWRDPRSRVYYALYRSTQEEYERRLQQWISTMQTMSEVNRQREVQRLEDARAEAERRQEQIRLQELQDQVREASRRMRADRHRTFLYQNMNSRIRTLPTSYVPETMELTLGGQYGTDGLRVDGSLDLPFWNIVMVGAALDVDLPEDRETTAVLADARLMIKILRRAGWITSTSLSVGGFVRASVGGEEDVALFESGQWLPGPFAVLDVLAPEWAHTRYGLYVGRDAIQPRIGWYPFWGTLENAIGVSLVGNWDLWREDHFWGVGLMFRPVDAVGFTVENTNFRSIRASLSVSF